MHARKRRRDVVQAPFLAHHHPNHNTTNSIKIIPTLSKPNPIKLNITHLTST